MSACPGGITLNEFDRANRPGIPFRNSRAHPFRRPGNQSDTVRSQDWMGASHSLCWHAGRRIPLPARFPFRPALPPGICAAKRPPDSDHPYGHFKYESLTQVAVGVLLFLTGYEVLSHSYDQFLHHKTPLVTYASILVMLGSIALQTLLYLGESRVATHSGDTLVAADAAHIKSDLLASGSVILGLFLSWKGFPAADPVIGVLIAAIIGYTGYHLLREGAQVLSDHSPPLHNVVSLVLETPGVVDCHNVRARGSRNRITMDLNVHVPRNMTVLSAHEIAHRIETRIRDRYPAVVEVIVHIEPDQEESHEPVNP